MFGNFRRFSADRRLYKKRRAKVLVICLFDFGRVVTKSRIYQLDGQRRSRGPPLANRQSPSSLHTRQTLKYFNHSFSGFICLFSYPGLDCFPFSNSIYFYLKVRIFRMIFLCLCLIVGFFMFQVFDYFSPYRFLISFHVSGF